MPKGYPDTITCPSCKEGLPADMGYGYCPMCGEDLFHPTKSGVTYYSINKNWLKEHGYHQSDCSPAYLYNFYGIKTKDGRSLDRPVSGWYIFINDKELNIKPRKSRGGRK